MIPRAASVAGGMNCERRRLREVPRTCAVGLPSHRYQGTLPMAVENAVGSVFWFVKNLCWKILTVWMKCDKIKATQ